MPLEPINEALKLLFLIISPVTWLVGVVFSYTVFSGHHFPVWDRKIVSTTSDVDAYNFIHFLNLIFNV
jgi:hypothetical protein